MADESVLSDEFLRQLINVGEVDLLVALPTHNRAATIASVVQAVRVGLLNVFPRERAALLIADFGSRVPGLWDHRCAGRFHPERLTSAAKAALFNTQRRHD